MKPRRNRNQTASAVSDRALRRRKRWFRLLAPVLAPLLFFAALETALRIGGYGYPTSFYIRRDVNRQEVLVNNPTFSWRFFGPALGRSQYPIVLPVEKPPGTIRIFVFGESAAYGDPDPDFGLPRMLQALLQERFPGTRFEVVNAAMVAINSNVILPIARECAQQHGDIWVIYMGNNEVVGPYGSGTVFGRQAASRTAIRASLAVKASRTGQLVGVLMQHLGLGRAMPTEWKGMMLFAQNKVREDDPRMALVYSHFKDNLADILKVGRDHQAKIVVSTVANNLRDCAPFASLHRPGLTEAQLGDWEKTYQAGIAAEQAGKTADAVALYEQCAKLDDQFADLQFRWARCDLALGRDEDARRHFVRARDCDALRFRADSRINEVIRKTAQNRAPEEILLYDAEKSFAEFSPKNLPGNELFYEHVHLRFEGNYLLARGIVDQVAKLLPEEVQRRAGPGWMDRAECAQRMVWTDWSEGRAWQGLPIRFPPFTAQLDHDEQYRRVEQRLQKLSSALEPAALKQTAEAYQQALIQSPDDWVLHQNLAQLLSRLGDLSGAIHAWEQVIRLLPFHAEPHLRLGLLFMQQGKMTDALAQFETELELDPHAGQAPFVKLLNETASQLLQQGKVEDAIRLYREALEFNDDPTVRINLGVAQIAARRTDEARESFKTALVRGVNSPQSLITLGENSLALGWADEGMAAFQRVLELDPSDAVAHCRLADALVAAGRSDEAGKHYADAIRLKPNYPEAHVNWGIVLYNQQKKQEALRQFEEALRIAPDESTAQKYIKLIQTEAPPAGK